VSTSAGRLVDFGAGQLAMLHGTEAVLTADAPPHLRPSVPRLWPASTIVILATGPSLCAEDVAFCRGKATLLAIKDAIRLAPDADALYACDGTWWRHYGPTLTYAGPTYALDGLAKPWASVLQNTGEMGLEADPGGLKTGRNSGYQAINLAVHLGARRIVLLGYDMQPTEGRDHFHGRHPWKSTPPYRAFLPMFRFLVAPLAALGITVVNASRVSALTDFPRMDLAAALA